MTLLVRNEQAIIRENIEYHLSRGIDRIIVTDNLSTDGTRDILADYERQGVVVVIEEHTDDYSQGEWVTRMARLAVNDLGARWVIHCDADEFWWPASHERISDYLDEVPRDIDGVIVARTNFVLPENFDEDQPFHAQMLIRERSSMSLLGKPLPPKVCHRNLPSITIWQGNHRFTVAGREPRTLKAQGLEVLHFPYRGYLQFRDKIRLGGAAYARNQRLPAHTGASWRRLYDLEQDGQLATFYRAQTKSPTEIEAGLAQGIYERFPHFSRYMESLTP